MKDKEIISLYLERNENAIIETAKKYGSYCYSISYNILNKHEDSEECVNDTYIKTWNSIPPQSPISLIAYLAKIVRNISFNIYRKQTTAKRGFGEISIVLDELNEVIPSKNTVEDEILTNEQQALLSKSINDFLISIDETSRNIMIKRYFNVKSISDISAEYSFSTSKVKSILHRNRKKLAAHLKKGGINL